MIHMLLNMNRTDGVYNNGFADNLELYLYVGLPVEPATWGAIKAWYR